MCWCPRREDLSLDSGQLEARPRRQQLLEYMDIDIPAGPPPVPGDEALSPSGSRKNRAQDVKLGTRQDPPPKGKTRHQAENRTPHMRISRLGELLTPWKHAKMAASPSGCPADVIPVGPQVGVK